MNLPKKQLDIVKKLYEQNKNLANGTETQRRQLTRYIVEQWTYDDPNGNWGHKARRGGVPSKDTAGRLVNTPIGQRIEAWDLFNGTTREPEDNPTFYDLTLDEAELVFYKGQNHLGSISPVEDLPDDESGPNKSEIENIEKRIAILEIGFELLKRDILKSGDTISLKSGRDRYMRDDWSDNTARFDRDEPGSGELYRIEKK